MVSATGKGLAKGERVHALPVADNANPTRKRQRTESNAYDHIRNRLCNPFSHSLYRWSPYGRVQGTVGVPKGIRQDAFFVRILAPQTAVVILGIGFV